jgi:RND family efflux transporter MFP subunit
MKKFTDIIKQFVKKITGLSRRMKYLFAFIFIIAIAVGIKFAGDNNLPTVETNEKNRTVTLSTVATLSEGTTALPILGTVTSSSEATIRAESSGKIVRVEKRLGDFVSAGDTIAYFENSAERAAVLQAEGAYTAAKIGGQISSINKGGAGNSLSEAKAQALNTISAAYSAMDNAVRTKTDAVWRDPQQTDPTFLATVPDSEMINKLTGNRISIENLLRARQTKNAKLTNSSDLVAELSLVESEEKILRDYLDTLSSLLSRAIPGASANQGAIDGYRSNVALARSEINGSLSSVTGARNALNAALSQSQVAEQNSGSAESNAGSIADSQIQSALGLLRGAQSRLEKTIIRSPISGTLNSLSINTGDFVSPFSPVAVVSNNGALEVLAYVTEDDARELTVGSRVGIGETAAGVITRIAPAIDPLTKKIEVKIGITAGEKTLINGQSVNVKATRQARTVNGNGMIKIPLSALKLTPSGPIVFTVSASSTLVGHSVKEGALLGDRIVINRGLTPEMKIVIDARGLQEGMSVAVQ